MLADVAPAFGILKVGDITAALPATLEVNDVITGYLEKADFPWEDLELTTTGIQDYASVGATTAVHIDFRVTEPAGNPTDGRIRMMLPPGWRYVPGSTVVAPALPNAIGEPTVTATETSTMLVWNVTGVPSGTARRLSVTARPGLALGAGTATSDIAIGGGISTPIPVTITVVEPSSPARPRAPPPRSSATRCTCRTSRPAPTSTSTSSRRRPEPRSVCGSAISPATATSCCTDRRPTPPAPGRARSAIVPDAPDQLPVDEDPGSEIQNDVPLLAGQDVVATRPPPASSTRSPRRRASTSCR